MSHPGTRCATKTCRRLIYTSQVDPKDVMPWNMVQATVRCRHCGYWTPTRCSGIIRILQDKQAAPRAGSIAGGLSDKPTPKDRPMPDVSTRTALWTELTGALGTLDRVHQTLASTPKGESTTLSPAETAIARACIAACVAECQHRRQDAQNKQRDEGILTDDEHTHVMIDFVVETSTIPRALLNSLSDLDVITLVRRSSEAIQSANWSVLRPRGYVAPAEYKPLPPHLVVATSLAAVAGTIGKITH